MQLEVKINLILHATEDKNKVLRQLENIFQIEEENFHIEQVPGHFNNPILIVSSNLKKKIAERFIKILFSKIKKDDFLEIYQNVDEHVTSSGLSLRLSKQEMISEVLTVSKEDAIKINISTISNERSN